MKSQNRQILQLEIKNIEIIKKHDESSVDAFYEFLDVHNLEYNREEMEKLLKDLENIV